jgi:hypothetical protein
LPTFYLLLGRKTITVDGNVADKTAQKFTAATPNAMP